ncbi:MAG TPA: DNA-processing protein DprA [Actinomycetota bacterium]|nr:DNA-processing protein DprA [Actinomycetota bacterium]
MNTDGSTTDAVGGVGRRPRDLAAERPRSPGRGGHPPAWPDRFVGTSADRSALVVLLGLAALTPRRLLELASEAGTASACLRAVRAGRAGSDGDRRYAEAIDPHEVLERVRACNARLVAVGDAEYPASLSDLHDPPAGLFVRGAALDPQRPHVSMVGARNCSAAGKEMALSLGRSLAAHGVAVVSGAARGIDANAHRGALSVGGPTVAVLGCGIDVAYPPANRSLLAEIEAAGTVVSEYPPGTPAEPFRFPARNRIVAALSRALVVVEGAEGSGSMISADHALELGREVFAVPGPVSSPLAAVPLDLIRDGATLIRGPDDLLGDLGVEIVSTRESDPAAELDPDTRAVWEALAGPSLPDQVARTCGMGVAQVMPLLIGLELRGLVRQAGGRFERRLER